TEIVIAIDSDKTNRLSLQIADNGQGFAGDFNQLGRLFVRHGRGSGSGVGLYIVRQLIKRMNGTIAFDNGPNGGFVAHLDLPEGGRASDLQHARSVRTDYEASVAGRR